MNRDKIRQWAENDLQVDVRKQWMDHIGGPGPAQFPRDVGFPHRPSVDDLQEMIDLLDQRRQNSNCYIQVYSDIQQDSNVWDTAYIDIDAPMPFDPDEEDEEYRSDIWQEKIEDAWWETKKYDWHMQQVYDADLRIYFSGSRGFSIYVDFHEIQCDFGAVVSTIKQTLIEADVDMSLVDDSVFEMNRISRAPYTLNWNHMEKRGLDPMLCLPVDTRWDFDEMLDEILDPTHQLPVERSPAGNILRDHIDHTEETGEYESKELNAETKGQNPALALERVQVLMELAQYIDDGRHRILHFVLVPALIEAGWEDTEQIHEVCCEFVEQTGASYHPTYYNYVEESIPRTMEGPPGSDEPWKPWSIQTLMQKNPDLLHHLDASELDT